MTTPTPYTCPDCGTALTLDTAAETDSPVYVQRRGEMPRLETRRRPCVVAFCSTCEFAIEVTVPR